MMNPQNLLYTKSHEWVLFLDKKTAKIGLTDLAQDSLGSLVFINLPSVGDTLIAGDSFGDVESVKAVSEVISPVSGTVSGINEELLDAPQKINDDPYGSWLVEAKEINNKAELLTATEYEAFCKEEE